MSVSVATIRCGEPGCDREFGSEAARVSHRRHIHGIGMTDPLSYPCRVDTCSATFGTAANRDEHMRVEHKPPGAPPTAVTVPTTVAAPVLSAYVCTVAGCTASFDTAAKIGTHRWSKHGLRAKQRTPAPKRPPSMVDRLLADEDEIVAIELRESLAKRLLDIVLAHGDGVHLDFTDPASLRREADRIELEQAVRAAIE